jgi:hypothetical protein
VEGQDQQAAGQSDAERQEGLAPPLLLRALAQGLKVGLHGLIVWRGAVAEHPPSRAPGHPQQER